MSFSGFYKKTREERIEILEKLKKIDNDDKDMLLKNKNLDVEIAGKMSENHIGTFALPFCVVPDILVDNKNYTVPMVTEEPSVVAALCNASKIINKSGGFKTIIHDRKMIGQVALFNIKNIEIAEKKVLENSVNILNIANSAHPSIVNRGGGAEKISTKIIKENDTDFLVIYLYVDVKEAMGANILNTMLEAIKSELEKITDGISLMGILSNYATSSLVTTKCEIKLEDIDSDINKAYEIAKKIELASIFAKVDPYRAATHNKGIFNGIDGVVIATGNDWRAIESACHTFACKNNRYEGLSTWKFEEGNKILKGEMTLPMPVATVGGSIGLNESVKVAHKLLNYPNAKQLSSVITSVGLAQNFTALKALVSVGIQKGHMKLHAKSLALLAGASNNEVEEVAYELQNVKNINLQNAKEILEKIKQKKK